MIEIDVAVIGGGFSGCAVAAQLARHSNAEISLALFEPRDPGRGAAYGSPHPELILNTRAHMMSLYPDDPDHFVRWLGPRGGATDFVSRRLYGTYVGEIAQRALARPERIVVADRARSVRRGLRNRFVVETERSGAFEARTVVLATGNPLPNDGFLPKEMLLHSGYVADPWRFDYRAVGGHVLVIGSGLSSLDVLVALKSSAHRGMVHVVSRHGRFPQVHAEAASFDVIPALDAHDATALLRSFRRHVGEARRRGFDWRAVVDAVRPEAETIWRRLSAPERRRFERHLRTHWERYRHRAPQQVESVRRDYERSGRLRSYAGRLDRMERGNVTVALREGGTLELRPDWIFNCSGVGRSSAMAKDPLLGGMLQAGLIAAEPSGLGLLTNWNLVATDAQGTATDGLWAIGPLVRGSRFEATAVPELRGMAEVVAAGIHRRLRLGASPPWPKRRADLVAAASWDSTL